MPVADPIKVIIPEDIQADYNNSLSEMPAGRNVLIGYEKQRHDLQAALYSPDPIAMLRAREGAGKTELVQQMIYDRQQTDNPVVVIQLNLEKLGELGSDLVVSRMRTLLSSAVRIRTLTRKANPGRMFQMVLFIDEIHKLNNYGAASQGNAGSSGAMNALKEETSRGRFPLIGATTLYEYQVNIARDPAFARRFSVITIKEPEPPVVLKILQRRIQSLRDRGEFTPTISEGNAKDLIRYANSYLYDQANPAKALSIMNKCIGFCRLTHAEDPLAGLEITHEIIRQAFLSLHIDIDAQGEGIKLVIPPELKRKYNDALFQLPMGDNTLIGYKEQRQMLDSAMLNLEKPSALLLGAAGIGKTALIEQWIYDRNSTRRKVAVISLSIEKLGELDENVVIGRMRDLLTDLHEVRRATLDGNPHLQFDVVLFIDEIHKLNNYGATKASEGSSAAMNALKEGLARGAFPIIGATTDYEYRANIVGDEAFDRRFGKVVMQEPTLEQVTQILKRRLAFDNQLLKFNIKASDKVLQEIVYYADAFIRNQANPSKSLDVLDKCTGFCRRDHLYDPTKDEEITHDTIKEAFDAEGYAIDATASPEHIEAVVKSGVVGQPLALSELTNVVRTSLFTKRNFHRPLMTAFFVGSTGVGKSVDNKIKVPVFNPHGNNYYKLNGELKPGDYVFDRSGEPTKVLQVFPHKDKDLYAFELADGRVLRVGADHRWAYKNRVGNGSKNWKVATTLELMEKVNRSKPRPGRKVASMQFEIPMNHAVQWPAAKHKTNPYVIGAFIGNGCLTETTLTLSSNDEFTEQKIAKLLSATKVVKRTSNYDHVFRCPEELAVGIQKNFQTADVIPKPLLGKKSHEKFIPDEYQVGSIEQRWELIQGLFDTDGTVNSVNTKRYNVLYSTVSEQLAKDIQHVLYSLGISSSITSNDRVGKKPEARHVEYQLHVACNAEDKAKFFTLPRKKKLAEEAVIAQADRKRAKKFGETIGIRSIKKLPEKGDATCIMVDNPEHLYQAGEFIVSHNTETAKLLAKAFFGRKDAMVMINCGDYATEASAIKAQHYIGDRVQVNKQQLILLDEIEKANISVMDSFMRMIDDGIARDSHDIDRSLNSTVIIATSNLGADIFNQLAQNLNIHAQQDPNRLDPRLEDAWWRQEQEVRTALQNGDVGRNNGIKPEFLERFSLFVPFLPLAKKTIAIIARMQLERFAKNMEEAGTYKINVQLPSRKSHAEWQRMISQSTQYGNDDTISVMIAEDIIGTSAKTNGARSISRYINSRVKPAVVNAMYYRIQRGLPIDGAFRLEAINPSFASNNRERPRVGVQYIPKEEL